MADLLMPEGAADYYARLRMRSPYAGMDALNAPPPDVRPFAAPKQGGVLDAIGYVPPKVTPDRTGLLDRVGQGAAVVDHWAMGIPSTMAGLVNSAIPGQPMGDLWSAKSAAQDARSAVSQSGYADLLSLPDAFMGSLGNVPAYAKPAAQLAPPAARQAGRLAESAIDPVYNALPDNSVGMFAGKMAKTADTAALARAEDMAAKGLPREQIWTDTGWFKGADGKWRFEIDDSGAAVFSGPMEITGKSESGAPFRDRMMHTNYLNAYPDAEKLTVQRMSGRQHPQFSNGGGYFDGQGFWMDGAQPDGGRGIALHEIQHDAQLREGFARGGSLANDAIYKRLAGEVEARTVQKRMDMTPDERRARPPWQDYDIPEDQQIVRFGGNGPQMSMGDGSAGGKLTPPAGIRAYHGSPHDTPMRVYHGNDANVDFDKFRTGPWMTESPEIASAAAGDAGASLPLDLQHLRSNSRPKVYPLDIEPKNPFIIDYNDKNPMMDAVQRYGYTSRQFGNDAHEVARANGHDFVIYRNTPGDFNLKKNHLQIVPLNENSVRSATNGKIMYGLPAAAYGMDQVQQAMGSGDMMGAEQ